MVNLSSHVATGSGPLTSSGRPHCCVRVDTLSAAQYNSFMRIVTYNIHGWRTADGHPNVEGVGAVLEAIKPDIVGLNEVYHHRQEGTRAPGPASGLSQLAARLDMHLLFGPCLRWPAQADMPENAYGNALLSRWPIIAGAAHHLTPKEEQLQAVLKDKEQRGLLEGRILLPGGQTFTVYVTHLDHTDEAARLAQLRTLRTWTGRDRNRPHVLMGDFNAISLWDWDEAGLAYLAQQPSNRGRNLVDHPKGAQVIAQVEKAGYVDLYRHHGKPGQASFLGATDKQLRIDYLFASASLAPLVTGCGIWSEAPQQAASDHAPVFADVDETAL